MRYRTVISCAFFSLTLLSADTLTLKDGSTVNGTFLGGSARQIRMEVGENIQTFDIERVSSIQFGSERAAEPAAPAGGDNQGRASRHRSPRYHWLPGLAAVGRTR